jgi:hypothetical protein
LLADGDLPAARASAGELSAPRGFPEGCRDLAARGRACRPARSEPPRTRTVGRRDRGARSSRNRWGFPAWAAPNICAARTTPPAGRSNLGTARRRGPRRARR